MRTLCRSCSRCSHRPIRSIQCGARLAKNPRVRSISRVWLSLGPRSRTTISCRLSSVDSEAAGNTGTATAAQSLAEAHENGCKVMSRNDRHTGAARRHRHVHRCDIWTTAAIVQTLETSITKQLQQLRINDRYQTACEEDAFSVRCFHSRVGDVRWCGERARQQASLAAYRLYSDGKDE